MKVFVIGATGYIGNEVTKALKAAGHSVVGLARSEEAAKNLEQQGVETLRGDLNDAAALQKGATETEGTIYLAGVAGPDDVKATFSAVGTLLAALQNSNKPFIYTAGTWDIGSTGSEVGHEDSPRNPLPIVSWRPALYDQIADAASKGVRAIVIMPALVYGNGGGMVNMFTNAAKQSGVAHYFESGENNWAWVHVEDLADLYVRALEKAPAGSFYIGANPQPVKVKDFAEAVRQNTGVGDTASMPEEQVRQNYGFLADALLLDQQLTPAKAQNELGWQPKAPSVLDDVTTGSYKQS